MVIVQMVMDTIVSLASLFFPTVQSLVGYIFSYQENFQRLETKVQRLEGIKATTQHSVDEAEMNGEKIETIVQDWLKEASNTIAEAKRLVDIEGNAELGWFFRLFRNLWTRSQRSKRFEEMTRVISEVIENGKFDRISYRVASEVAITPFCRGYEALESTTTILNEMKEALKDPKIYMIGVHGMGGVGKTTLVKELFWQVKTDGSFAVAIATITQSPEVEKIQDQLAEMIMHRKLENTTNVARAAALRQMIRNKKSILIILDDIWSELDLTEVGIPFGEEHNGCKLVVTARDLNVLIKLGSQKEFNLKALLEADGWNLFQKMAGDVVKQINIKPIAEKVAKCCAGLPLLIVIVANGLRKKNVTAWRDALNQLERFDHEELQNKVSPTLELSYNCLEDELKSLFLFIGSFGLDHIHTGELFSFCWGLGFYSRMETLTEARNRHYRLINDLRASSLLLESELEWVRMHDVVRDVAKSIAFRSCPIYAIQRYSSVKEWPKVDQLQKYHYIIIPWSYIDELPKKLECPELKLLQLENIGDVLNVPDNFFSGIREVRALNLHGLSLTLYATHSLHLLRKLRSLDLCKCDLGDIRMVGKLTNLEILSLEKCNIKELPKEIGHLTHLRMLNLTNCNELRVIPTNLLSSLTSLEELYMGNCHIKWEVEGSQSENASLGELRSLHQLKALDISIRDTSVLSRDLRFLAKLERYNILIGNMWKWSIEWSGGDCETSRTLKLTDSLWTDISLTTVEDLSFAKLKHVKDVLYELDEEGFLQLKRLHIQDSDELLHIINSKGLVNPYCAFPNLESLVLCGLNNMEGICYGPLPIYSFAKLRVIEVRDCDRLKNLLPYSLVRNLSHLHMMHISNCNDIEGIVEKEIQEDEKEFNLPKIVFPELHTLALEKLPKFQSFYLPLAVDEANSSIQSIPQALFNKQVVMPKLKALTLLTIDTCKIWDDQLSVSSCIQNLTRLVVIRCDRLTTLFSSSVARELVKLQNLWIEDCSMLQEIFVHEEQVQFPNLEILYIGSQNNLKSMWPNQLAPNSFCKLRTIRISDCENLDYVFPMSVAKELQQLQDLEIECCSIRSIVEKSDMTPVYIEKLTIRSCYNMKTIVPSSVLFRALDELVVEHCDGLVNIITPSTIPCLPKLSILTITNCEKLEEIYGNSNEGDELRLSEVAFMKLEELRLRELPRLTSFCQGSYNFKFRSLQMVDLEECPLMETFCHGKLTSPSHTKVRYGWREKESKDHWYGDLNTTVRTIFTKYQEDLNSSAEPQDD